MMANKIKIWGRANSGNVKKVLVVADELGVPYERVDAGMNFGIVDTPEYRKLNPNSRVPTIEDGDYVLWESHAICRYLAMQYGGEAIYPKDPKARASIDRWLDWLLRPSCRSTCRCSGARSARRPRSRTRPRSPRT
jgi:glutathione S-transferase